MPDPLGLLQTFGQKVIWNSLKRVFGWLRRRLPVTRAKLDRRLAEATAPAGGSWEARYRLSDVGNGTYVGVLRTGEEGEDDPHWICAACMDRGQRSVLNRYGKQGSFNVWSCARCPPRPGSNREKKVRIPADRNPKDWPVGNG